uniref:Uncharacterized protein n=1 Tax=Arundo donax TaxID=35708 RepID=A0A0A8Z6J3_ARUDO
MLLLSHACPWTPTLFLFSAYPLLMVNIVHAAN